MGWISRILILGCLGSALVAALTGCGQIGELVPAPSESVGQGVPEPEPPTPPQPPPAPVAPYVPEKPLWESKHKDGALWSAFTYQLIGGELGEKFLPAKGDVTEFCPKYEKLTRAEKVNFWAVLISAMVKYESGFNPTSRYWESTMGNDDVTGEPTYSEGLLQLSYQDVRSYGFCKFDWAKDRKLSRTDPKKTIFDPYLNLDCGLRIFARQIERRGNIALSSGVYWAVIKRGGKYTKIPQIQAITKALRFC